MTKAQEYLRWNYEQKCLKTVENLGKHYFTAVYCPTVNDVLAYIMKEAENAKTVGLGGSVTLMDLEILDKLNKMNKEVLWLESPGLTVEAKIAVMRRQLTCDLFLTSTNAVTTAGCLVNIDAVGNRVASSIFGPGKVIFVVGRNKIVDNTEEALKRIKNYTAPTNCMWRGYNNPCAKTGVCHDCQSPNRSCRITVIMELKPRFTDIHVLIANEDMGL
jgi:hypothetical protein